MFKGELGRRIHNARFVASTYVQSERRILRSLDSPIPQEVVQVYDAYRTPIYSIYGDSSLNNRLLFHGTGALQYDNQSETGELAEKGPLQKVLEDGLKPKPDRFVRTPGNLPTTSLATSRFYAKWYAMRFQYEPLAWEYGQTKYWAVRHLVDTTLTNKIPDIVIFADRAVKNTRRKNNGNRPLYDWMNISRNDLKTTSTFENFVKGYSTIQNNFGAIFIYDEGSINTFDIPVISRYEKRSSVVIPPTIIKAIEVPLKNIEEVKKLCSEYGITADVIPMECVEMHLSQFPLDELLKGKGKKPTEESKPTFKDFPRIQKEEIQQAASGVFNIDYFPQKLLEALEKDPFLEAQFKKNGSIEGYNIKFHTLAVLAQFEKYFSGANLPGGISTAFFRTFLALHDIGKGIAWEKKKKNLQHSYNSAITVKLLHELDYSDDEVNLARALLSGDPLGNYIKRIGTLELVADKITKDKKFHSVLPIFAKKSKAKREAIKNIRDMADVAGIPVNDFFNLLLVFHKADASSYTKEGGAVNSLSYIFSFDEGNSSLSYIPYIGNLVEELREGLLRESKSNETGLEVSRENYIKATHTLALICEHLTGVPIPEDVLRKWKLGAKLLRIGDDRIDNMSDPEERKTLVKNVVNFLRGESNTLLEGDDPELIGGLINLKEIGDSLDPYVREELFEAFDKLIATTEAIKYARTVRELTNLNRLEGEYLIQLFMSLLPEEYKKIKNYPHMERVILSLSRVGNVFDTISDLSSDFESGVTLVKPTRKNRAEMFFRILPESILLTARLKPSRDLLGRIAIDAKGTIENNSNRS